MSNIHKISIAVTTAFLLFAVIFGLLTKNSYKYFDSNDAIIFDNSIIVDEVLNNLDSNEIISQLSQVDYAFIVTVKTSECIHEATKTTVYIEKVIKGDTNSLNQTVYLYEPNFIYSLKNSNECNYFFVNFINNLMQPDKQYLVFADRVKYSDSYQKTLDNYEYQVNIDFNLYSFPLDGEINCIDYKNNMTFKDVKSFDYFCYTDEQKDILENIRLEVFDRYL